MVTTKAKAQISMDEKVIDDPELEKELEERQELKYSVGEYRKRDKSVKGKLREIKENYPFRVGRFVISKSVNNPRSVSFETSESIRYNIKLAGEEEE